MSGSPLYRTLTELAPGIRAGRLSPVRLVEEALERIRLHDGALKSIVHVWDSALAAARQAEEDIAAGDWRGPLHGIPIVLKDNYLTADMPTRAGAEAQELEFPYLDSGVAVRLREAGAVLLAKARMHEFGWGTATPPARNPWDLDRTPGGSSGGSAAAVAAGFCIDATGTDTGGSIRIPASLCGLVGLKPTFGRVSRAGTVPHSWSLDHAGPIARSAADAAAWLDVLAVHDPADPASADVPAPDCSAALDRPVRGLRLGVIRNYFFRRSSPLAASWRLTYPFNLTGLPAVSLPCGFDRLGLPIGLQIAGRPFEEALVLRVAHAYETSRDWRERRALA